MTTILQFTDLHLLSRPDGKLKGVPTFASAQLVLERARREVPDPACVVVTGDLSHEETLPGYELVKELLGDWADRALLLPGNHDDRTFLRQAFAQVPGSGDEPIWFRQELGPWQLLGLDSHVPSQTYGSLSEQILDWLTTTLDAQPACPTLLFLHHPPVRIGSQWLDNINLRNANSLESIIAGHGDVRGLFCGHIHQVFAGKLAGVPVHSTPAAAIQFLPGTVGMEFDLQPPGFRVIEIGDDDFETRVVRLDHLPFRPVSD